MQAQFEGGMVDPMPVWRQTRLQVLQGMWTRLLFILGKILKKRRYRIKQGVASGMWLQLSRECYRRTAFVQQCVGNDVMLISVEDRIDPEGYPIVTVQGYYPRSATITVTSRYLADWDGNPIVEPV
jgi:hypothetical protein